MRLAGRPQSHSWCRSVAGGHETRQISVLSIMTQDENESMAESRQKGGFKNLNKTFAGWCKTLRGELEHSADISFSPWSGRKRNPVCSVCSFLGRHASIFTLAERGVRCLCLTERVSLHQDPVGSTPAMTGGRAMGERQQKKSDSRWQLQHKHLRVRTPPWKESEGCLFSGAAGGRVSSLGQSSRQTKGRTDCTPHCRTQLRRPSLSKILSRSFN